VKTPSVKSVRCAIYTRVSTDHGLDQEFNSLDCKFAGNNDPLRGDIAFNSDPS
jgi:hypothetical protein